MLKWLLKQGDDEERKVVVGWETEEEGEGAQEDISAREGSEETAAAGGTSREQPPQGGAAGSRGKQFLQLFLPNSKPAVAPQVWASVTVATGHLGVGCVLGLAEAVLPQTASLQRGPHLPDPFLSSLFNSVAVLSASAGSVLSVVPQVWWGQRLTLLAALPLALTASLLLALCHHPWLLIAARALQGLGVGFLVGPSHNYIVEIAHTSTRGTLLALLACMEQLGFLAVNVTILFELPWRQMVIICSSIATVIPFFGMLILPDSPRWLVARHRLPEATNALSFFRGPRYNTQDELKAMTDQQKKIIVTAKDQLKMMENPGTLGIILGLTFLILASHFTGHLVISIYIMDILNLSEPETNVAVSGMVVAAVRVVGALMHLMIVEHVGRRKLLTSSFFICAAAMAMLGSYFYDSANTEEIAQQTWIPLVSLATFTFFISPGFALLSLLREELLSTSVRSTAVAFLYCLYFVAAFIVEQTYQPLITAMGHHGTFWLYAVFGLLVALAGLFGLLETRGLSLEEICSRTKTAPTQAAPHKNGNVVNHSLLSKNSNCSNNKNTVCERNSSNNRFSAFQQQEQTNQPVQESVKLNKISINKIEPKQNSCIHETVKHDAGEGKELILTSKDGETIMNASPNSLKNNDSIKVAINGDNNTKKQYGSSGRESPATYHSFNNCSSRESSDFITSMDFSDTESSDDFEKDFSMCIPVNEKSMQLHQNSKEKQSTSCNINPNSQIREQSEDLQLASIIDGCVKIIFLKHTEEISPCSG